MRTLAPEDFLEAAHTIAVEPAALRAVADVESSGSGFLADGRPKILFEAHVFYQQLKQRGINPEPVTAAYPGICARKWNRKLYRGGVAEWGRLAQARAIHEDAALCSASWGLFQLMGFNHRGAGFATVQAFVEAMHQDERQHLLAIVRWMQSRSTDPQGRMLSSGLLPALRRKDWAEFAARYNGPGYRRNHYDERLAAAYALRVAEGWSTTTGGLVSTSAPATSPPIVVAFRAGGQIVAVPPGIVFVQDAPGGARVFVHLRSLAAAMGWQTRYDAQTKTVTVEVA